MSKGFWQVVAAVFCAFYLASMWISLKAAEGWNAEIEKNKTLATTLLTADARIALALDSETGEIVVIVNGIHPHRFMRVCPPQMKL